VNAFVSECLIPSAKRHLRNKVRLWRQNKALADKGLHHRVPNTLLCSIAAKQKGRFD
jgi:hypothetical protein